MPKNVPLEKQVVKQIMAYLNGLDRCMAFKTHGGQFSGGQPDIIGCIDGRFLAFEVKRPGGKATELQLAILEKWRSADAVAAVVYSVEDVMKEMEGLK